jgi:nucleoporin NUP42
MQGLASQAEQQIQTILSDLDGAVGYIAAAKDNHPNRWDICKASSGAAGQAAVQPQPVVGQPAASAFGQPSALGNMSSGSTFGQPSTLGNTHTFAQPSQRIGGGSAFGQPSQLGGAPSTFGQPSQVGGTSGFGQPSQLGAGFGQPSSGSAFGQPSQLGGSTFGQPAQLGGGSAFGAGSAFGRPSQVGGGSGAFGQPSQIGPPVGFGQLSPISQMANAFSNQPSQNNSNPFAGAPTGTSAGVFERPSQAQTTSLTSPHQPSQVSPGTNPAPAGFDGVWQKDETGNPVPFPIVVANPYPEGAKLVHPDLRTYSTRDPSNRLITWKSKSVIYVDNKPCFERSQDKKMERISYPDGPPPYNKDTELPESMYDEKTKDAYLFMRDKGYFKDGWMPNLPPRREWCKWDF